MQTAQWGAHNYIDLSDLNARWDQDFPGGYNPVYASPIHGVSNGALSGNSLGIAARGVGADPSYPWRSYSADTKTLQQETNEELLDEGYLPIDADGVLGPATCGAIKEVGGDVPGTCQSFEEPIKSSVRRSSFMSMGGGGANWLIIGGAVAAFAVGGALLLKGKK